MKKAKKTSIIILTLLLLIILSACSAARWQTDENTPKEGVRRNEDNAILIFTAEEATLVREAWKEGRWLENIPNCASDYIFYLDGIEVKYHAACGTFYRPDNGQTFTLKEAKWEEINRILALP